MLSLPFEIWIDIFKYLDLENLSKMSCLNKYFNYYIKKNKWDLIDQLYTKNFLVIPKTKETYLNYYYCIDWSKYILNRVYIPEDVIRWITNTTDLEVITLHQKLSPQMIEQIYNKVQLDVLIAKQEIPLHILYEVLSRNDNELSHYQWYLVWSAQPIDYNFVLKYFSKIQWQPVSCNKHALSYELISNFSENLIWSEITRHGIHEDIINEFKHKMDFICWSNISEYTQLSTEFMRDNLLSLEFNRLLRFQTIEEDFLFELVDNLVESEKFTYVNSIVLHQKVSLSFLKKYTRYISFKILIRNEKILRKDLDLYWKFMREQDVF